MALTDEQFRQLIQGRFSGLSEGQPQTHDLEMAILEAVYNEEKREVLNLLKKAVDWKTNGHLDEATDICRQAVERDPTILFSRQLLSKLEKMKADPESLREAERLREKEQERAATRARETPAQTEKKGCPLNIILFVCVLSLPFVVAGLVRSGLPEAYVEKQKR